MTIRKAINDALAGHWVEFKASPATIRANPSDLVEVVEAMWEEQEQSNARIENYWPSVADKSRADIQKARSVGVRIDHWVNYYDGGKPVPVVHDPAVEPGEVVLTS